MSTKNLVPVHLVMKSDNDVTHFHETPGNVLVLADILRLVMGGAVNVNRRVVFLIIKVWFCSTRFDQELAIAWRPEHEGIYLVEPSSLQLAVATLTERGDPFCA
jgi:hypothetical protein